MGSILVSISCLTYNHGPYIRKCLEGFMMQKTNFKFEVLIHDDASTDGTEEIIREYESKYPEIIKPLYETENQWLLGRRGSKTFNYPRAKGKYIALCEGDDYWTDPLKLQKQVDFLETNTDYSMCFHSAIELWEGKPHKTKVFNKIIDGDYSAEQIYKNWIVPTASVIFRKKVVESTNYMSHSTNPKFIFGDIILFLSCCNKGKVHGFSNVMSVYRRHEGGMVYRPSLERDFKQSLHDLEIGKIFDRVSCIAKKIVFYRSCRSLFISTILWKKNFINRFLLMFKITYEIRYMTLIPRAFLSALKGCRSYLNNS